MPCNTLTDGKYTWNSVCFIEHIILGKQYIHSFGKYFLSSIYVPGFSKTNISTLMELISMVSGCGGRGGGRHVINKQNIQHEIGTMEKNRQERKIGMSVGGGIAAILNQRSGRHTCGQPEIECSREKEVSAELWKQCLWWIQFLQAIARRLPWLRWSEAGVDKVRAG